jgi:anti-anti-sigma factor
MTRTPSIPGELAISIEGDLFATDVDVHQKRIFDAMADRKNTGWQVLRLDLTGVPRIDSMGLNLIVNLLNEIKIRNSRFVIVVREGEVQKALHFTHLDLRVEVIIR